MESLKNKIDFAVVVKVKNANPNGDPLNGNRPRTNYDGLGELSDVCVKRKIRNRLIDNGFDIFVQSDDKRKDDYRSLRQRAEGVLKKETLKDEKKLREDACKQWIDVRAFGQVFAFEGEKKEKKPKGQESGNDTKAEGKDSKGVSVGIRGPVSIHPAFSINPVSITSEQITKSVSGEGDGSKRGSDTMGTKHRVDFGVYAFYGSMNPQLASLTGFSDTDANAIKEALRTLFLNDESSARPAGSMEVVKLLWWKHNNNNGQYSTAKVHRLLSVDPQTYDIKVDSLDGLECEQIEGL